MNTKDILNLNEVCKEIDKMGGFEKAESVVLLVKFPKKDNKNNNGIAFVYGNGKNIIPSLLALIKPMAKQANISVEKFLDEMKDFYAKAEKIRKILEGDK